MSRRARQRDRIARMSTELAECHLSEPEDDGRQLDDEADPAVCPECQGDGRDKWSDYLLPCPVCGGER